MALLGPNGAGKSTAVDLLLGLREPDEGSITVLGGTPALAVAAGRVGCMLQTGALPQGTRVRDLLALARSLYGARHSIAELLELADLADLAGRASPSSRRCADRRWVHLLEQSPEPPPRPAAAPVANHNTKMVRRWLLRWRCGISRSGRLCSVPRVCCAVASRAVDH